MKGALEELQWQMPPGFECQSVTAAFVAPPDGSLAAPLAGGRAQAGVRANLMLTRQKTAASSDLATEAKKLREQITKGVRKISHLETQPLAFADGVEGVVFWYDFPTPDGLSVRQYQALRLDTGYATLACFTDVASRIDPTKHTAYLDNLASLRLA